MPQCQECGKIYGVINSNHLRVHGMTLSDYIEKWGDPNTGNMGPYKTESRSASPKEVKEKVSKPKKALSYQAARTVDELYALDETIVVPKRFIRLMEANESDFDRMMSQIMIYKEFDIDTETTGLDMFEDIITDVSITIHAPNLEYNYHIPMLHIKKEYQNITNEEFMELFKTGRVQSRVSDIRLENVLIEGQFSRDFIFSQLKPVLEDKDIKKNLFNDYFDEIMLWADVGINLAGLEWDGLVAAHILNENEPSHKLKDLYRKYLHEKEQDPDIKCLGVDTYEEQFGKIKFFRVPMNVATAYASKDSYMTGGIKNFQKPYIDTTGRLANIFYNIEMPLIPILVEMRKEGIGVDLAYAKELEVEMKLQREQDEKKIYETLGDINLNSPKQLSHALFDVLKLPDLQKGSTKAEVLQELADEGYEVAELLLDYKKSEKLISTYLEGIGDIISKRTGRIHCRFNGNGTKTGRLSSSGPNLQNIPAKNKKIRKIFRAKPGFVLISCDYSQIEPRLLAHIADDANMIQSYIDGKDIYSSMAAFVFTLVAKGFAEKLNKLQATEQDLVHYASPIYKYLLDNKFIYREGYYYGAITEDHYVTDGAWKYKEITLEDCFDGSIFRKYMKTLLLGMMYSMSEKGLASRLKIDEEDALEIMNYFFKAFPNIRKAMNYYKAFCKNEGYVETMDGRKRRLPDIWSEEWWIRKKAERQVLNSVIQGTAADVMKKAMLAVGIDQRIKDLGAKLLLSVHDELILEAPKEVAVLVAKYVIEDMVGVCDLKVPLKVDGEIFTDGRWYGESIAVKNKKGVWKIFKDIEKIVDGKKTQESIELLESEIEWAV